MSPSDQKAPVTCRVVTPEAEVLHQTGNSVVVPVFDGLVGILANHAAMVALVGLGEMRVREGESVQRLAVEGGLATVKDNEVTVIATRAQRAEDLQPDQTQAEARELEARRPEKDMEAIEEWRRAVAWNRLCDRLAAGTDSE